MKIKKENAKKKSTSDNSGSQNINCYSHYGRYYGGSSKN